MGKESQKTKVELHPAYVWTCDHCGIDNFERGVVPTLSPEEESQVRSELGIPSDLPLDGIFQIAPAEVQCRDCNAEYDVDFGQDEEDDTPDIWTPDGDGQIIF